MTVQELQTILARSCNTQLGDGWNAYKATARDGTEYIELMDSSKLVFTITIQKVPQYD